jgi:hypothetical protein
MKGFVEQGHTKIFEVDGWTNNGPIHTFTGRLTVYARKVVKNPFHTFRVHTYFTEAKDPMILKGNIQKCTSSELQIKIL